MDRASGPIRALIEANLLINLLLSPDPERSAAAALLAGASRGEFVLVVPPEVLAETARVLAEKPRLASRVSPREAEALVERVLSIAEVPPRLESPLPRMCRDPGDDYLIAHAILAQVDYLVTRDRDLLDLGQVGAVRIIDPVVFLPQLRAMQELSGAG